MELVGAKRILERSLQKNKLRYTSSYGDGDSKSFSTIKNIYQALQSKNLKMCRTCSETSWLSFAKF